LAPEAIMLTPQQAKNADHVAIDLSVSLELQLVTPEEPSMISLFEQ
jgi:hypothetical protein